MSGRHLIVVLISILMIANANCVITVFFGPKAPVEKSPLCLLLGILLRIQSKSLQGRTQKLLQIVDHAWLSIGIWAQEPPGPDEGSQGFLLATDFKTTTGTQCSGNWAAYCFCCGWIGHIPLMLLVHRSNVKMAFLSLPVSASTLLCTEALGTPGSM